MRAYSTKMFKKIILLLTIAFISSAAFSVEKVAVSLDKEAAFVGDIINFKVTAELPLNAQISANQKMSFDNFDIREYDIKRLSDNPNVYVINFKIAAYKTGILEINRVSIFYLNPDGTGNLFYTPEAKVEIKSVLGDDPNPDIKDIKPLLKLSIKFLYVFFMIIAFAAAGVFAFFLYKNIMVVRKLKEIAAIDPRAKALNDLDELYVSGTIEKAGVKIFYYKMSEILRSYVSKQYKFDALEMTTSEFFDKMKTMLPLEININEFKTYLKVFNLARYAGFKPDKTEVENNFKYTKNLLEKL